MGIFIFLTVVVVEMAFAVFCIISKSNQQKVRSIVRIAAFTGFMLLVLMSIIEWGIRYYTLAALLFLLAAMGAVALIRKREEKREYKSVRVILRAIGMTVLIFVFILPAIIFPQHKALATTGKYKVATKNYTYTDEKRIETYTNTGENRKLNVEMWYPENAEGTYPLVVFSHGSLGTITSNETLYNELASHGYVVCSIGHTYQSIVTTDVDGHTIMADKGFRQELSENDAKANRQQSYENFQKWMKIRTDDINFVIDYILAEAKNKDADRTYKLVDATKIGVMGHSLGGSAALGIGRIRKDVSAVIALEAPFMCDIKGVQDGQFVFTDEIYPIPVLNVYSDSTWGHLAEGPEYAENYTLLSHKNATAFNIHISGVGHFTLTDLALLSPLLTRMLDTMASGQKPTTGAEECLKTINKVSLEFFDCYLKGEGKFTSDLNKE